MLNRSFLLGVAVGTILGLFMAPNTGQLAKGLDGVKNVILGQNDPSASLADKGTWPTSQEAKDGLFALSKWGTEKYADESSVEVIFCITIDRSAIACELAAKLSWVNDITTLEGVFRGSANNWKLVSARQK